MKKLMVMMGAVATTLGLFATGTASYSNSFEANDDGVSAATGMFTPGENWDWTGDSPMALNTNDTGRVLPYTAAETPMARRTFTDGSVNDNYLPLDTGTNVLARSMNGNVFVDQLVKFTGFEEPPTSFVDGAKIAVWMSAIEADDTVDPAIVGETNFYVTVGKEYGGTVTLTNLVLDVDANGNALPAWQTDKWYRLTIKSLDDIYGGAVGTTPRAGFIVYIDGVQVASSDPAAKALIEMDTSLTSVALGYMSKGALFPSFGTGATAATVGYQGIGAIDDLYIDNDGPEFARFATATISPITGAYVVSVKDMNDDDVSVVDGKFNVAPGTTVIITFAAENGYILSKTTHQVTVNESMTIDASSDIKPAKVVAYVNEDIACTNFVQALQEVQKLEVGEYEISVSVVEDADEAVIPGKGTFDFAKGTFIVITPGSWSVGGEGKLLATIDADNAFTVKAYEVEEEEIQLTGALTYAGTVAGTLEAVTIALPTDEKITLAVGGQVITTTALADADFIVPSGYQVARAAGTGDYDGYTIYTAEASVQAVAKIGDTEYATIEEAFAAAEKDAVITVLSDLTVNSLANIKADDITLDANGKVVTFANAAMTLSYDVKVICSGETAEKGLKNKAQITVAAGKTLDLSALAWGAGLVGDDQNPTTACIILGAGATYKQGDANWSDDALAIFSAADENSKLVKTQTSGVVTIVAEQAAAKIGTVLYITLADAAADAKAGDTITILTDLTVNSLEAFKKDNLTIDANGNLVTLSGTLTLTNDIALVNSGAMVVGLVEKGFKNNAQISIAAGKTLDVSALGWAGNGLVGFDAGSPSVALGAGAAYKQALANYWDDDLTNIFSTVEGYEITLTKASGVATIASVELPSGPTVDPGQGAIDPPANPGDPYVVKPTGNTVNVHDLPAGASVEVPATVTTVTGVDEGKLIVKSSNSYNITDALNITTAEGTTTVGDVKQEKADTVEAEIAAKLSEIAAAAGETKDVTVTLVPGLTYTVHSGSTLTGMTDGTPVQADDKTTTLTLPKYTGSGFYQIKVTK